MSYGFDSRYAYYNRAGLVVEAGPPLNMKAAGVMLDSNSLMRLPYNVVINLDDQDDFVVQINELQGCVSHGKTLGEALIHLSEMQRMWLEMGLETGDITPLPIVGTAADKRSCVMCEQRFVVSDLVYSTTIYNRGREIGAVHFHLACWDACYTSPSASCGGCGGAAHSILHVRLMDYGNMNKPQATIGVLVPVSYCDDPGCGFGFMDYRAEQISEAAIQTYLASVMAAA